MRLTTARWGVAAEMAFRDLVRRRAVLGLLFLLPLAFYLARHEAVGQSVRFVGLGLACAVGTAALFSGNAGKAVEPRLRLGGFHTADLYIGRFAALLVLGWGMGAAYFGLILLDRDPARPAAIAILLGLTAVVAVPVGLLISAVVPRDLEGTLLLITLIGVQFLMDPARPSARLLPFWSTRELATYAIDPVDSAYLHRGLTHGLGVAIVLTLVSAALAAVRLRRRGHIRTPPRTAARR